MTGRRVDAPTLVARCLQFGSLTDRLASRFRDSILEHGPQSPPSSSASASVFRTHPSNMPPSRKSSSSTTRSKKANSAKAAAKAAAPAKTAEQIAQEEHDALVTSASKLIHAVTYSPVDEVKRLLKEGAPTWYQEESMGWNCLHFAAERGDADIVKACLSSGAVWNAGEPPCD